MIERGLYFIGMGMMSSFGSKIVMEKNSLPSVVEEKIDSTLYTIESTAECFESFDAAKPITYGIVAANLLKRMRNHKAYHVLKGMGYTRLETTITMQLAFQIYLSEYRTKLRESDGWRRGDEGKKFSLSPDDIVFFEFEGFKMALRVYDTSEIELYAKENLEADVVKAFRKMCSTIFWRNCKTNAKEVHVESYGWDEDLKPVYKDLDLTPHEFYGPLRRLRELWPKYKAAGLRRTAILQGIPGGGKTTLAYWLAREIGYRTVSFTKEAVEGLSVKQISDIMKISKADFIIFNDIHTVNPDELEKLLSTFEESKDESFQPDYIVCTSNEIENIPEPLRRPGRLGDEIYWFDKSKFTPDQKLEIVKGFERDLGIPLPEYREWLRELINEFSTTFVKEVMKRIIVEGIDEAEAFVEREREIDISPNKFFDYEEEE